MFQLTQNEWANMSSQNVMTYPSRRPKTALPLAFTEHGVTMLANVLKSKKARLTSVTIVRAFIVLKQFVISYKDLYEKVSALESKYDVQFKDIYDAINFLLQKDKLDTDQKSRKRIGFK